MVCLSTLRERQARLQTIASGHFLVVNLRTLSQTLLVEGHMKEERLVAHLGLVSFLPAFTIFVSSEPQWGMLEELSQRSKFPS